MQQLDWLYFCACNMLLAGLSLYDFLFEEFEQPEVSPIIQTHFDRMFHLGGWLSDECDYVVAMSEIEAGGLYRRLEEAHDLYTYKWKRALEGEVVDLPGSQRGIALHYAYCQFLSRFFAEFISVMGDEILTGTEYKARYDENESEFHTAIGILHAYQLEVVSLGILQLPAALASSFMQAATLAGGDWRNAVNTCAGIGST